MNGDTDVFPETYQHRVRRCIVRRTIILSGFQTEKPQSEDSDFVPRS